MMSELTTTECSQLEKCETTIERGINTFVEVGEALAEIRNAKLYRAFHRTFEAYCDEKWKFSRQRAYQLIDQAKVVRAVADAAGADLSTAVDKITEREAREIKGDLPAVAAEIKSRVERGEIPAKAVADVMSQKREARRTRGKNPEQDEWDRQRDEHRAQMPAFVAEREAAKAANTAKSGEDGLTDGERIEALESEAIALEEENARLKAENKKFGEMRVQFEKGGFEEVIRGKDAEISALKSRVERESKEKVANLNSLEWWKKQAIKLGWTDPNFIPVKSAVANG
jgi:hypothetical protein